MKRFSSGKSLSDLEENVYGDDGIVIICNDKQVKAKDLSLFFLDCRESLLENCRIKKDTLMSHYLSEAESNFTIQRQLEQLNNEFLSLEAILQNYMTEDFNQYCSSFKKCNLCRYGEDIFRTGIF